MLHDGVTDEYSTNLISSGPPTHTHPYPHLRLQPTVSLFTTGRRLSHRKSTVHSEWGGTRCSLTEPRQVGHIEVMTLRLVNDIVCYIGLHARPVHSSWHESSGTGKTISTEVNVVRRGMLDCDRPHNDYIARLSVPTRRHLAGSDRMLSHNAGNPHVHNMVRQVVAGGSS